MYRVYKVYVQANISYGIFKPFEFLEVSNHTIVQQLDVFGEIASH